MLEKFNVDSLLENNFEYPIILRGEEYYVNNSVTSVICSDNDHISANVIGMDLYSDIIDLKKGRIVDFHCNCPYENHCKHEVAVLLYLYDNLYEINGNCDYENQKLGKLNMLSKEELLSILWDYTLSNNRFREYLYKIRGRIK